MKEFKFRIKINIFEYMQVFFKKIRKPENNRSRKHQTQNGKLITLAKIFCNPSVFCSQRQIWRYLVKTY
jgi:hypothetical protein